MQICAVGGGGAHRGAVLLGGADEAGGSVVKLPHRPARADRPVAFLFPGLGDHYPGMGHDLYQRFPVFRSEVDRCAMLLEPELGFDIRDIVFTGAATPAAGGLDLRRMLGRQVEEPAPQQQRLDAATGAQPALFVIEYALARLWQSWGVRPDIMLGYSLGEYVAACLAGVLSLPDSLRIVAQRARLIETLPPGRMLAVLLPEPQVRALLGPDLFVSAVNGPEFCVVAGAAGAVDALHRSLAADGVTTRAVRSTHPFHTPLMAPIADQVTRLAGTFTLRPPQIPYLSNVTGRPVTDAEATDPGYWARHLCGAVRFADGLDALGTGRVLLETGPGQNLSSIAVANTAQRGGTGSPAVVVASMRHAYEQRPDAEVALSALGKVWLAGGAVDARHHPATTVPAAGTHAAGTHAAGTQADGTQADGTQAAGEPAESSPTEPTPTEPTPTERALTELWAKLLKVDIPGPDSDFFELGGSSLIAGRLLLRIGRTFGVEPTLRDVYERPTIAGQAAHIDALTSGGEAPAAPAPSAAPAAAADKPPFRLPNGLSVVHQNEAETLHFYEDIFEHRSYVKHGIRIPDGGTVVDVGGNIGLFTLFAHYAARDVQVYTFEPAPPLYELLAHNVATHGVRAHLFNIGIADRAGQATFTFYPRSSGMSSFHPDEAEERHNLKVIVANQHRDKSDAEIGRLTTDAEELLDLRLAAVPCTARLRPLSDVIREQGIERIDLLKIDVQKSELEVINGIADQDWPKIRAVAMEAHDGDNRVAHLCRLLEDRGFTVIDEQDELYVGTDIHLVYATRD